MDVFLCAKALICGAVLVVLFREGETGKELKKMAELEEDVKWRRRFG